MQRPLIVTDPGLAKLPMIANALAVLEGRGPAAAVFSDMQANPVEANVTQGVAAYRSGSHDGVIAFGGGSALDVGKAIALMSGQTRPIFDFEDREDWFTRVDVKGMAPVVAVPTTAGTGSEVGPRLGHHRSRGSHEEDHLSSEDDAGHRHRRSGAHRRAAAAGHGGNGHGCALAIASKRTARRSITRWRKASPSKACGSSRSGCRWPCATAEHRGARAHAHRVVDGRDRVPEGARRHAQPESSLRGESQHASRAHECGGHAVCARMESAGHRGEACPARRRISGSRSTRSVACWTGCWSCAFHRHSEHAGGHRRGRGARVRFCAPGVRGSVDGRQSVPVDTKQFEQLYLNCIRGRLEGRPRSKRTGASEDREFAARVRQGVPMKHLIVASPRAELARRVRGAEWRA